MFAAMGRVVFIIWIMIVLGQMRGYRSCIDKERKGLVELKADLNSLLFDPVVALRSWTNGAESDCCRWERIQCNRTSRRVIGLDLSNLMFYQNPSAHLNLSLLYPFEKLRSLNLSWNLLDGLFDDMEGHKSLGRYRELEILDLTTNRFTNSIIPFLKSAASLKTLILRGNFVNGTFPIRELKNFTNLKLLDLSWNFFNGPLPRQAELADLRKLEVLDLSDNEFSDSLENQGICTLRNLRELDISKNNFVGHLSSCFGSLTKLQVLDISSNQLSGNLPSAIRSLESLEYLSLSDNNFEDSFSFSLITNFSKLKVFKLSSRLNQLQVLTDTHLQPKFQLNVIRLRNCKLEEIPSFLMDQRDLLKIDLSNNRLSGAFPTWLLENNQNLEVLLLQNNSFSILQLPSLVHNLQVLDVSVNHFGGQLSEDFGQILPNIRHLNLSNNRFQGNFPSLLGKLNNIYFLDLSHNNFSGNLPGSFLNSCHSLSVLKLSHNKFTGQFFPKSANLTSLSVLYAENNLFTGQFGDGLLNSKTLAVLDISNNSLTGAVPSWMGNLSWLSLISASNNFLEGTIPASLLNISGLQFLDLSGNAISGSLPPRFNNRLESGVLYLHDNSLTGPIPETLLENLIILDLRNNMLSGNIPHFVNTQSINILLLRGNHLTGHIPNNVCELSNIMLLDLAHNRLNGSIPSCLNNVSFGMGGDREILDVLLGFSYSFVFDSAVGKHYKSLLLPDELSPDYRADPQIDIEFSTKRRYDSYTKGNLGYMFGLDLSNNELSGEIPEELGDLRKLRALNLSQNSLSGLIPDSFSNLTDIESLDLSFNRIYGRIPSQITRLDYLVVFNVSYNNLSGVIPQGKHFSTLDESSYFGNPLLCGPPTNRSCDVNGSEEQDYVRKDDETAIDMEVFYWSLFATYVSVLMGFLVFMCFDSPCRRACFRLVDAFIYSVKSKWF